MGKIISVFSHKGGVGKTTLVHNIGFILANHGKKVLLIDADSQMNLTSAVAGFSTQTRYKDDNKRWQDFLSGHTNIAQLIKNLDENNSDDNRFYKKTEIYKYKNKHSSVKKICFTAVKEGDCLGFKLSNGCLHLLPSAIGKNISSPNVGDRLSNIAKIELALARALNPEDAGAMLIPRIKNKLEDLASKYDFIIIDTAPNASSILNAILMMSSDYFMLVGRPDFFSLQAIDNMDDIFSNWSSNLKHWLGNANTKSTLHYPKFLGFVTQMSKRFGSDKDDNHLPTEHTKEWSEAISQSVTDFVRSYSRDYLGTGVSAEESNFLNIFKDSSPFVIRNCCDFTPKLRSISEKAGLPVSMLNNAICKEHKDSTNVTVEDGNPNDKYQQAFKSIFEEYTYIVDGLIKL